MTKQKVLGNIKLKLIHFVEGEKENLGVKPIKTAIALPLL